MLPPVGRADAVHGGDRGGCRRLQGAWRSRARENPQPPRQAGRADLRLRIRARTRPHPGDGQPSPEEADGRRPARARAAWEVGVLLHQHRGACARLRPPGGSPMIELREEVRQRYAAAATGAGCGCSNSSCCDEGKFGEALYSHEDREQLPDTAALASLGCGNPTAVAELHEGETVLDLGSGGGIDVILSARRVGERGLAFGLDMTDEMLALARRNAEEAGIRNAIFLKGHIEEIPLPSESVDVVISNCVINLSADKPKVIAEAARVLRPGGRFAVSDVIADPDMDAATRADMGAYTGCIAGALTREEFVAALSAAGLEGVEIV